MHFLAAEMSAVIFVAIQRNLENCVDGTATIKINNSAVAAGLSVGIVIF